MNGLIRRIERAKMYGFIRAEEGGDYFFHRSECITDFSDLTEGTLVKFRPTDSPKGPRAVEVESV
jgi:cold shock CspA family protein